MIIFSTVEKYEIKKSVFLIIKMCTIVLQLQIKNKYSIFHRKPLKDF